MCADREHRTGHILIGVGKGEFFPLETGQVLQVLLLHRAKGFLNGSLFYLEFREVNPFEEGMRFEGIYIVFSSMVGIRVSGS
jgi:hypothetical protein